MRIEGVKPTTNVDPVKPVQSRQLENKENEQSKKPSEEAVVYEPSDETKKPTTYNKSGHVYDKETIAKLKQQSDQAHAHLISLVEKLLMKQGHSIKTITAEDWANIKVDEETRLEAQKMIDPGGPLSPEAVSDRLVDFAKAIAGGDISKLDKLRGSIEKGFKEAERILGGLPDISKKTYEMTMEKLDAWEREMREPAVAE